MRLPQTLLLLVSALGSTVSAASSWTFADGSLSVTSKGAGSKDGGVKEKLVPSQQLSNAVSLGSADTLKITLTIQEGKTAKRPHQAFLLVQDQDRRLDVSYPFSVKESGKAVVSLVSRVPLDTKEKGRRRENMKATMCDSQSIPPNDSMVDTQTSTPSHYFPNPRTYRCLEPIYLLLDVLLTPNLLPPRSQTQRDLPAQFLAPNTSLTTSIILASFGASTPGYNQAAFTLQPTASDPSTPFPATETPLRYGKLPEIHHIFRSDPKSPPVIISLVFFGGVLATIPFLVAVWLYLGANISALPSALSVSPVSHTLFVSSVAGIEFVFFLYYTSWNLFQTLPALGVLGVIAFLSGSRALGEVQERRLGGTR
ncbi:hypothetical protein CLCR_00867 [Cladophialophora carrionii]|uniref:Ribophorin II C-terminal domain-containing protein n=1 Tax=Cladophialophora carrionii TaxID=86049 RepID=A0A1C1D1G2_9EURO|nr:hypothetical protein CLCR_00867 [Cladophialophora carrionii]